MTRGEMEEVKRHFDVVAEGLRSDIRMIAEGHLALQRSVDSIRVDLDLLREDFEGFRTEMYAFRSEMYAFRDEMYGFRAEMNRRLGALEPRPN